jgi:hypothetical protein
MDIGKILRTPLGPKSPHKIKWTEPFFMDIRLYGDLGPRLIVFPVAAIAAGLAVWYASGVLDRDPTAVFAGAAGGFLIGGLLGLGALLFREPTGATVSVTDQGITRHSVEIGLLFLPGLHTGYWPPSAIKSCAFFPSEVVGKRFSLLAVETESGRALLGVPRYVDLEKLKRILDNSGVAFHVEETLRPGVLEDRSLFSPRSLKRLGSAMAWMVLFSLGVGMMSLRRRARDRERQAERVARARAVERRDEQPPGARAARAAEAPRAAEAARAAEPAPKTPQFLIEEFEFDDRLSYIKCPILSPDGTRLLGHHSKEVVVWQQGQKLPIGRYTAHEHDVQNMAIAPDSARAVSVSVGELHVWDIDTQQTLIRFDLEPNMVAGLALSGDGKWAYAGERVHLGVHVCNIEQGQEKYLLVAPEPWVSPAVTPRALVVAEDGSSLFAVESHEVQRWNLETRAWEARKAVTDASGYYLELALSPSGLAVSAAGREALVWDLDTGTRLLTLQAARLFGGVAISRDGRRVFLADGNEISIGDVEKGSELCRFRAADRDVDAIAVTPDGRRIATLGDIRELRLWEPKF